MNTLYCGHFLGGIENGVNDVLIQGMACLVI